MNRPQVLFPLISFFSFLVFFACGDEDPPSSPTPEATATPLEATPTAVLPEATTPPNVATPTVEGETSLPDTPVPPSEPPYDLTVLGRFPELAGLPMAVAVIEVQSGSVVERAQANLSVDGSITFYWRDILEEGASYRLDAYVDQNGSSGCETDQDILWRESLAPAEADLEHVLSEGLEGESASSLCEVFPTAPTGPYDLTITGTLLEGAGKTLRFLVRTSEDESPVASASSELSAEGTFVMSWQELLSHGVEYEVLMTLDLNGNGGCDGGEVEPGWKVSLGVVKADANVSLETSTPTASVCDAFGGTVTGPFDLLIYGSLPAQAERSIRLLLLSAQDSSVILEDGTSLDAEGAFRMEWLEALSYGGEYFLDVYLDANSSGACEAPPQDLTWRFTLGPVVAPVELELDPEGTETDVCELFVPVATGPHDLAVLGQISEAADKTLYVAVYNHDDASLVSSGSTVLDLTGSYSLTFSEILSQGGTYRVDAFVDLTGEGTCDTPPLDLAWSSVVGPVTQDVTLAFETLLEGEEKCGVF